MTIDYKLQHLHATADDSYKSNRAQAFAEYMSPPSIDSMEDFLDVMSDHGLPVAKSAEEFLEGEDAEDEMETLMGQLECWAILMQAKLSGFRALQEEGFEAIKAEADLSDTVHYVLNDEVIASGEWCRRGGICYVSYDGKETTTVAMRGGRRRNRDKMDREMASWALQLMFDHQNSAAD